MLDPHTGRLLALTGGYDFRVSEFNRATQARRQPGSAFKPFVYLAALDQGYTPTTRILDAPWLLIRDLINQNGNLQTTQSGFMVLQLCGLALKNHEI